MLKPIEYFRDYCSKSRPFNTLLAVYYRLAIKSLAFVLKKHDFKQIIRVYLRHSNWILGASDIDLIVIMDSSGWIADADFFKKLWKSYGFLRKLFPVLCGTEEIKFIPEEQIKEHPLRTNGEALLLLSPHKWKCIYSRKCANAPLSFTISRTEKPTLPHTRFLHFNFYGYIQQVILSGEDISELKFCRLRKNIMKIIQHLLYLKGGDILEADELTILLSDPERSAKDTDEATVGNIFKLLEKIPENARARRNVLLSAFQEIVLLIQGIHDRRYDLSVGADAAPHSADNHWMEKPLKDFIKEGNKLFAEQFRFVITMPIYEAKQRAFLLINEKTDRYLFEKLIAFSNQNYRKLSRSGTCLYIATDKILTSQFYALWGPHALEAHILSTRQSFNPGGRLKIKLPPDEWTLWKIRNSLSILEEYYLPFVTSPRANSKKTKSYRIYETPEVEMLFHYLYYLKDREAYYRDLKRAKGESDEIICLAAAKYADEIGLSQWHPDGRATTYPYIKKMIRLIDRMADEKIRLHAKNV